MRILALTNLYPNPQQPHRAAYNRQHFREFAAEHDVRVIAPIAWTDELAGWRSAKPRLPRDRRANMDGLPVDYPRYLFTPKVLRNWYGSFYLRSVRGAFDRAVEEFRPDIVFSSWAYPDGWAATALGHAAGIPVIVNVVGSDVLLIGGGQRQKLAETVRAADGIVAASEDLATRVIALGADPTAVRAVHNGVNVGLFRPGDRAEARRRLGLSDTAPVLLFVGNLVPVKGVDILVEAIARLVRGGTDLRCYLVGRGRQEQAFRRHVAANGLDEHVRFVGAVPHERLPDWFRAADVFVLPSRSEGVPNVLLEAFACGTPCVATRVGGIPEVASSGTAELVESEDSSALAAAIQRVITAHSQGAPTAAAVRSHSDAAAEILQFVRIIINRYRGQAPQEVSVPPPEARTAIA